MIKEEWKELFSNTWFKIVIIAIIIIPCVYAGVFLGSMWDPYGKTENIPVAVVNEDKVVTYQDQSLAIGEELVKNLKDNDSMNFCFIDKIEAQKGLEDGQYYMVITIPEDFSQHATTLLNKEPEKMILHYTTNPGTNYIASKMDDSAIEKIKNEVSSSVTETYAKTIFTQIETLSQGLTDASLGTQQLNDGVNQLIDGNQTISQNLEVLSKSSLVFEDGAKSFQLGIKDYTDGVITVNEGVYALKDGLDQLNQSTESLSKGIDQLNQGSQTLATGITQYTEGLTQTYQGSQQLVAKETELNDGISNIASATQTLEKLNQQMNTAIQNYQVALTTGDSSNATQALMTISTLQKTITVVTTNLNSSMNGGTYYVMKDGQVVIDDKGNPITTTVSNEKTLKNSISQYTNGVQKVNTGLSQLDQKSSQLVKGSQTLSKGIESFSTQTPILVQGIQTLDQGSQSLYQGTNQLVLNNQILLSGAQSLSQGAKQINDGSHLLFNGSTTLGNGLGNVQGGTTTLNQSLSNGAKESQIATTDQTFEMISKPVETQNQTISTVENNGHAMAPYMMSVALYVACLAFALMYPLQKNVEKAKSGFHYWLSKSTIWFFISTVAALAMIGTLMIINGFNPQQTLMTFIFAVVVAAAFMSLVTFLSILTGRIGEFLLLIFMVINLGGSAGTYPLETSGFIYQLIHPFVPFTYSVNGFRKVISQTNASIINELIIFIGMIIIFSGLTILVYHHRMKKSPIIPQAFEEAN